MPHDDPDERRRIASDAGKRSGESKRRQKANSGTTADPDAAADFNGPVGTWTDAKKRLECQGEKILNLQRNVALEAARMALERERGKLLTREQVDAYMARARDLVLDRLAEVAEAAVSLTVPEKQAETRLSLKKTVDALRSTLAQQLKDLGRTL